MGGRRKAVPLTDLQIEILRLTGSTRTPENYVAGGTALHFRPNSVRYSRDLDIFHDALEAVAPSFEADSKLLRDAGFSVSIVISQPGFIRAAVEKSGQATQVDWARDSAWRFMPVIREPHGGYMLHEIDVATNKVLALAGRNEPRDYIDVHYIIDTILALGPLVWAATAKDPGFSPLSLLEMLKRRGQYRAEEIERLDLARPLDLEALKRTWLHAVEHAESFILSRPASEAGCLYYRAADGRFVEPAGKTSLEKQGLVPHYGRAGGVLPVPSTATRTRAT